MFPVQKKEFSSLNISNTLLFLNVERFGQERLFIG